MPHQVAITVRAPILVGHDEAVAHVLSKMHEQGAANDWVPFTRMPGLHFARLVILEQVTDPVDGTSIPASLVYMGDVDAACRPRHLKDLATSPGINALFGHCRGYPTNSSPRQRVSWLRSHLVKPAARYVHTVGRTVRQVRDESSLRDEIERYLDRPDVLAGDPSPEELRNRVREHVLSRPDLAWAGSPPKGPDLCFRVREAVHLIVVALVVLVLIPVLVPAAAIFLVLIRIRERTDQPEIGPADPQHVHDVEQYEDYSAQNPFTAIGFVKAGIVRRITMRVALFGLDYANRHFFGRDNLAGVRTIHFARWVPLDDGRRVIFASNYDGSQESYMNDFIDRLASGLNLVFSNGVGYPRTRWLVCGGARDEAAFKHYLRRHQVPTVVWYSAYDSLPAPTIDANSRLRRGLTSTAGPATEWLDLL